MLFLLTDFRDAYRWQKAFNEKYIEKLKARLSEAPIWKALKALLVPSSWLAEYVPVPHLTVLADFCKQDAAFFPRSGYR